MQWDDFTRIHSRKIYNLPLEQVFEHEIKKPLGYTRSKFNIALDEPNAATCYRSKNVDGLAHPWDDENIRILQSASGSGGQFFSLGDIKKFADAIIQKSPLLYSEKMYDLSEKKLFKRRIRLAGVRLVLRG